MSEGEGRRIEGWLRRIFWMMLMICILSLAQAISTYTNVGSTESRLRRLESSMDSQRKFNADLANTLKEWADGPKEK